LQSVILFLLLVEVFLLGVDILLLLLRLRQRFFRVIQFAFGVVREFLCSFGIVEPLLQNRVDDEVLLRAEWTGCRRCVGLWRRAGGTGANAFSGCGRDGGADVKSKNSIAMQSSQILLVRTYANGY